MSSSNSGRGAFRALLTGLALLALTAGGASAQRIVTLTEDQRGPDRATLGYPVPTPIQSLTPVDGFRTYGSLFARHQDLMMTHAAIQGSQVGTTIQGRPIWAYVLSDADASTPEGLAEPAVLVGGGIHAREWQSPEVSTGLIERFAEGLGDGGFFDYLAENLNLVVLPVINPDGLLQTQRFPNQVTSASSSYQPRDGRMRRKSMNNVDNQLTTFGDRLNGVDLNRNYPVFFTQQSSGVPTSIVYRGPNPLSEPETQGLLGAAALAPEDRLRLYVDLHSFSQAYFGLDTNNSRRNALANTLSSRMRATNGFSYSYRVSSPAGGLPATSMYFGWTYEIPSYTIEIEPRSSATQYGGNGVPGDGFILPESEIRRVRGEVSGQILLGAYHQAGPPTVRAVQVHETGAGVVYSSRWVFDPATARRRLVVDVDQPLSPGRSYRLWVAFDKPMRWRSGNQVINYPGQQVTLAPAVRLLGTDGQGQPVTINLPSRADSWLATVGPAPDGAARYRDDAFAIDFSLPIDLEIGDGIDLRLELDLEDLAQRALDARPATPADWSDGGWTGYEDATGAAGDDGGPDRTIQLRAGLTEPPGPCVEDARTLCLLDGRFGVSVDWRDHRSNRRGEGTTLTLSDKTGMFWFFDEENIELIVKALDGRLANDHFWFFYGALSDVEYTIRVKDSETGRIRLYRNDPGEICGRGDTTAFFETPLFEASGPTLNGAPGHLAPLPNAPALSRAETPKPRPDRTKATETCSPDGRTLCLLQDRFRLTVNWRNQRNGRQGFGTAVPQTDQSGLFWFFEEENIELVVKVLDGRAVTGKFWVFYGGLSDVEYTLTVEDTVSGAQAVYRNPPGEICGRADTNAL